MSKVSDEQINDALMCSGLSVGKKITLENICNNIRELFACETDWQKITPESPPIGEWVLTFTVVRVSDGISTEGPAFSKRTDRFWVGTDGLPIWKPTYWMRSPTIPNLLGE